ncbi:MAG: class I SAM-dependent methyltransferase [Chloroflexota bacterium]
MDDEGQTRTLKERVVGRGWELLEPIEQAFHLGEIDEAEWHRRMGAIIGPAYLAGRDPREQSGHAGSPRHWENARRFIFDCVRQHGTFLDIGCASGHLMECAQTWLREAGYEIEPYGLDILPELVELARRRLPRWAKRIWLANALHWIPPRQFDFVRTGLEYVPRSLRPRLIRHLLDAVVQPGGRLIIGAHSEVAGTSPQLEAEATNWGFSVGGRLQTSHDEDPRVVRRAFWIDGG